MKYGPTFTDYVRRQIQLSAARRYIDVTHVVVLPDPPAIPYLHLFPGVHRALRPLRRARLDLHRLWSRRRAT